MAKCTYGFTPNPSCGNCGGTGIYTVIDDEKFPNEETKEPCAFCLEDAIKSGELDGEIEGVTYDGGKPLYWIGKERPGYFGKKRDQRIFELNAKYGAGKWRLAWIVKGVPYELDEACRFYYEESYFRNLSKNPDEIEFIRSFGEVIDNAPSNVDSGTSYLIQEASATHIQDIAIRNVLRRLKVWFTGPPDKILVVRGAGTEGERFNPGNVPFAWPELITQPSLAPKWAKPGSVEDFWQSNKWVQTREG